MNAAQTNRDDAGPLADLFRELDRRFEPATIDQLWIFPPHAVGAVSSAVAVLALFTDDDERRRVVTGHITTRTPNSKRAERQLRVSEEGIVPADRAGRIIDGMIRRLGGEFAALPHSTVAVAGRPEAWAELLASLAPVPAPDPVAPPEKSGYQ